MANPNLALDTSTMSYHEKMQLLELLEEKERRDNTGGHLVKIFPEKGPLAWYNYTKHIKFIEATKHYDEVYFMAGNRVGKSVLCSYICACHLSGNYPSWYMGRKFDKPITCLMAGTTSETTKLVCQNEMLGRPGEFGTGMVAADLIANVKSKPGVPDGVSSFKVKHASGGWSWALLKSYDQKRKAFEGITVDVAWCDEEPPIDVYGEITMRTFTTNGLVMVSATPLTGMTKFVQSFIDEADTELPENNTTERAAEVAVDE